MESANTYFWKSANWKKNQVLYFWVDTDLLWCSSEFIWDQLCVYRNLNHKLGMGPF